MLFYYFFFSNEASTLWRCDFTNWTCILSYSYMIGRPLMAFSFSYVFCFVKSLINYVGGGASTRRSAVMFDLDSSLDNWRALVVSPHFQVSQRQRRRIEAYEESEVWQVPLRTFDPQREAQGSCEGARKQEKGVDQQVRQRKRGAKVMSRMRSSRWVLRGPSGKKF